MSGQERVLRGRYELRDVTGVGAQGRVWRGWDLQHRRTVAVKERAVVGDADALLAEARALLEIKPHPALPIIRDDFFEGGCYWLIMDWVDGARLDATETTFEEMLDHLERVAAALDHLHGHAPPVCHRDVKPANIVVGGDGAVLVDFGLAYHGGVGSGAGTPAFLAPEVAAGDRGGPPSDVYSLAVTVHVLMTGGRHPEPGATVGLTKVPPEYRDVVSAGLSRGLSINPDHRPGAGELIALLRPVRPLTNLASPVGTFIGRADDLAQLDALIGSARLVTLVGPGGVGKSALAEAVARRKLHQYPGGTFVVDLGSTDADNDVLGTVESALMAADVDGIDVLGGGRALLVLDTCERVLDGTAGLVEEMLARFPELTVLAVSRERLRVPGEQTVPIEPLNEFDAAELFVDRAKRVAPRVTVGRTDPRVAAIVDRVDRLPLAIELAAARVEDIGLEQLGDALQDTTAVLTQGSRTRRRHETMEAAIRWSWDLLDAEARVCLRRLSVFSGGFTRAAAERVVGAAASSFDHLRQRSLVAEAPTSKAGGARYRLFDTIRDFARLMLDASGERAQVLERHQCWIRDVLTDSETKRADAVDQPGAVATVDEEFGNISAAVDTGGPLALDVADLAWANLREAGRGYAARRLLERAVAGSSGLQPSRRASVLQKIAASAQEHGELEESTRLLEEAMSLRDGTWAPVTTAAVANSLGTLAARRGDLATAERWFREGLAVLDPEVHRHAASPLRRNLAGALMVSGDTDAAAALFTESLADAEAHRDWSGVVNCLANLGHLESTRGRGHEAETRYLRGLDIALRHGVRRDVVPLLVNVALLWMSAPNPSAGARAWGAALAAMEREAFVIPDVERGAVDADVTRAKARFDSRQQFDALVAEGRDLAPEDVYVLGPQWPEDADETVTRPSS